MDWQRDTGHISDHRTGAGYRLNDRTTPNAVTTIGNFAFYDCTSLTKIWAPDAVVNQLTGPFSEYSTFASIPRAMRAAPDATTWAAVQLWMWWSPPTKAGYTNRAGVCKDNRIVCKTRRVTLFTTTMAGVEAAKARSLPSLPPPIWLLVFGFLKHDEAPVYPIDKKK